MRRPLRLAVAATLPAALLASLLVVAPGGSRTEASHAGGMDAMSIDVDITGNTATSLGPRDECIEAGPGDVVTIDVTATNIPATTAMIAFTYTIQYDESRVWVETQDHQFLLAANAGSGLLNGSDATPDQDPDNEWTATVADLSSSTTIPPEYGSGVLSRLTINVSQDAPDGTYGLALTGAGHVDAVTGEGFLADVLNNAVITVGVACPEPTGRPSPEPTSSPIATATPRPPVVAVTFEPMVHLRLSDASVAVRGTLTCSNPQTVEIEVAIVQFVKGVAVITGPHPDLVVPCNGDIPWSATMEGVGGRFRPGFAEAVVIAHVLGYGTVGASGQVDLKPGAVK